MNSLDKNEMGNEKKNEIEKGRIERNKETESTILNLESLTAEYDTVLLQYNQAQTDYVNFLKQESEKPCSGIGPEDKAITQKCYDDIWKKTGCTTKAGDVSNDWAKQQTRDTIIADIHSWATMTDAEHRKGCYGDSDPSSYNTSSKPDYNINQTPLTDIKGQAYWGMASINEGAVTTIDECKAMCMSSSQCTGATYNPDKNYCWARSGEGQPMPALPNDYAIIPSSVKYLNLLSSLNGRLTAINNKIMDVVKNGEVLYKTQTDESQVQSNVLNQNYNQLKNERNEIQNKLKQYEDLDATKAETDIRLVQNNYYYIFFFLMSLISIFILYKLVSYMQGSSGSNVSQYQPNMFMNR